MRKSTFISLIALLVLLSIYFLLIDPLLTENRWAAFASHMLLFVGWRYLSNRLQNSEKLEKRFDSQTSVWLVVATSLFFTVIIIGWQ